MSLQPTLTDVLDRLRIDADATELVTQVEGLIDQAHAEMLDYLDRAVYADAETLADALASADAAVAAQAAMGIVATPALVNAQILLIGFYLDESGTAEGERMHTAARRLMQPYRRQGA